MRETLTCDVAPRIDVVNPAEWQRLFPDLPDSLEMIQFIQRAGLDNFRFHSIVVRQDEQPILFLPLFETTYRLSTLVEDAAKGVATMITACFPPLCHLRLLGVGFVEGEWGQVGVDPQVDRATLDAAWDLALQAFEALAKGVNADLTAFAHFTAQSGRMLPMHKLKGFSTLVGLPYASVPIVYTDVEAYIRALHSPKMRADLRRKLRKGQQVEVLQTRDPGPWLDAIYRFYLETVARSNAIFGVHRRTYFEQVCRAVPDAQYHLYFVAEQLVAFKLVVVTPDCLMDKYFGMDHALGRAHNVYFVAWADLVRYCIQQRIPRYYVGQAEEETKHRLGAQLLPNLILFKHRHALVHRLFTWLARWLAYQPPIPLAPIRLGSDWDEPSAELTVSQTQGQVHHVSVGGSDEDGCEARCGDSARPYAHGGRVL